MPNDSRLIGFAALSRTELFPSPRCRLASFDRSLGIFYDSELILSRLRLFRAPSPLLLAHRLSARASPAWVLGPLRDITRTQPRSSRRLPSPSLRSVPRLSQPLGGLLRARACRLISSRCHVQGPPVQGLLSPRSHPSSSEGAPPLPSFRRVLTDFRRLPPASDLGFEVFIRARPRSMQRSYSPRCTPLPSSVSSPPGSHSFGRSQLTRDLRSRRSFAAPSLFAIARRARPQRLSRRSPALRLRSACLLEFSSLPPNLRARDPVGPQAALRSFGSGCAALRVVALAMSFVSRARVDPVARTAASVPPDIFTRARVPAR
jgi:hypothetical protein